MAKISKEEWEKRIKEAGAGRYELVRWLKCEGAIKAMSRVIVRCNTDRFEWDSSVNNLVNHGRGCPQCSGKRRWTADERTMQVNATNKMKFVSWLNGYNGKDSKANVICNACDYEWAASIGSIVNNGSGCPKCYGRKALSSKEWEDRLNESGGGGFIFIDWPDGFNGAHSKARFKCLVDDHEWTADANHVFRKNSGCPECAGNKRYTPEEYEESINKAGSGRFVFVRWAGNTKRAKSKVVCRCISCEHNWSASVDSLTRTSGCPRCAKYGFQLDKIGYLYALRSECGRHMKIGISNNPKRRHKELEKRTPFKFNIVEQLEGDGTKIAELEKYFHSKYERAGFTGFSGCTEWLISNPQLLEELRTIGDK